MDLGAFDLNTLVALRALLEEGNLTYAGAKVGMAQPAMSSVLGRYRRHFDDELLVRVGRDYELTPLARDLLPLVQEAVRLLGQSLRISETFDPATTERLFTVTVSDYAMTVLLEPALSLLPCRVRYPQPGSTVAHLAAQAPQSIQSLRGTPGPRAADLVSVCETGRQQVAAHSHARRDLAHRHEPRA